MIRLTGGTARGRVLPAAVPGGVRPTASRVREALFSMIGQDLAGWSMLDLCGGTGLVALEAASRGAGPVTVVERSPAAAAAIRKNAAAVGVRVELRVGDARSARLPPAELVFLDPPYREPIGPWLERAAGLATRWLVAEVRSGTVAPAVEGFVLDTERRYGDTTLLLYVRRGTDAGGEEAGGVVEDAAVVEHDG